jgi:hypothetical protein
MKSTVLLAVWLLCFACPVPAPVMATDDHCDRAKRYEALSAQVQQTLQGNAVLLEVHTHTGSAYHMGYVYTLDVCFVNPSPVFCLDKTRR